MTLNIILGVLQLIERLGEAPQKFFKVVVRAFVYTFFIGPFVLGLYLETSTDVLSKMYKYYFLRPPSVSARLEYLQRTPVLKNSVNSPEVTASSAIVIDMRTDKILFSFNEREVWPPASTTKLMTAVVALETFELDALISMPLECVELEASRAGFEPEELISVQDLVYTVLISSAADSACALAYADTTYGAFIAKMNKRAYAWGAYDTNFSNPVGFDDPINYHYSSAYDLYIISKNSLEYPLIREIVQMKEYTLLTGDIERTVFNTNDLLWKREGSIGIKTGRTLAAGEVLTYRYKVDNIDLFIAVLGSEDRFLDTETLLDWTLESYIF